MDVSQLKLVQQIYRRSPVSIQNLMVGVYGIGWYRRRFGKTFQAELIQIQDRENWDRSRLDAYCDDKLRQLIRHAYEQTPYYRKHFAAAGIGIESFRGQEDLQRLPFLYKDAVRQDPYSLISRNALRGKLHRYLTSGTSGTPLEIYFDPKTNQRISAYIEARCRCWAGVSWKDTRSMIGGRIVVPPGQQGPPYWRYNFVEKQLYMSAFHISPSTVADYVAALNESKPTYMAGYTASNYFLARLIQESGLAVHSPRCLVVSSEKLQEHMRETMETVFKARVFDCYSGVEACGLASECPSGKMHVSIDMGIIEVVDSDGEPVAPGVPGELVFTGLANFAQPLIRYRTGDVGALSLQSCSCGRPFPILVGIEGRSEDLVVTADGREMVRFHGVYVGIPNVREGQIIQETLDRFVLRVVPSDGYTSGDQELLISRIKERVGPVRVDVVLEKRIERTERGKFRAIISRVPREQVHHTPAKPRE